MKVNISTCLEGPHRPFQAGQYFDLLGRAYEATDKPSAARFAFLSAAKADPTLLVPHQRLALMHMKSREWVGAKVQAQAAVNIDPDDTASLFVLGKAHLEENEPQKAWQALEKCTKSSPQDVDIIFTAGRAALQAGLSKDANRLLERSLSLNAPRDEVLPLLAQAMVANANHERALPIIKESIELFPEDMTLVELLAKAQLAAGDHKAAAETYKKLAKGDPGNTQHLQSMYRMSKAIDGVAVSEAAAGWGTSIFQDVARALTKKEANDVARFAKQHINQDTPKPVRAWLELVRGTALADLGFIEEAIPQLEQAASTDPAQFEPPHQLGKLLLAEGRFEPAAKWLEKARNLAPKRPTAWTNLADAYLAAGKVSGALKELQGARSEFPDQAEPAVALIRLLALREQRDEALPILREAHPSLTEDHLRTLRSDLDFKSLWSDRRFRMLVGPPLPARNLGKMGIIARRHATGKKAITTAGELEE